LFPMLFLDVACSYAFVHRPPANVARLESAPEVPQTALSCTSSNAAPVIDTVLAVPFLAAAVLGVIAAAESPGSCNGQGFCFFTSGEALLVAGGALAVGTLFLSSAITGYGRTADCRRLEEALPGGPHPSARHLLDLNGIVAARTRENQKHL